MLAERDGHAFKLTRKAAEIPEDIGRELCFRTRLRAQRVSRLESDGPGDLL